MYLKRVNKYLSYDTKLIPIISKVLAKIHVFHHFWSFSVTDPCYLRSYSWRKAICHYRFVWKSVKELTEFYSLHQWLKAQNIVVCYEYRILINLNSFLFMKELTRIIELLIIEWIVTKNMLILLLFHEFLVWIFYT